jgi:hypothetical protein
MGFIPNDARWYLADLVFEYLIEDEPNNLVHVNLHLIEADSPDRAYDKALALGRKAEHQYDNTDGKQVRVVFRGLRELTVIHDCLEDGAELSFGESVGVPEEKLREWIPLKERLGVFAPIEPRTGGPNYMPESIMRMLEAEGFDRKDLPGRVGTGAAAE